MADAFPPPEEWDAAATDCRPTADHLQDEYFEPRLRRIFRSVVTDRIPTDERPPHSALLFGPEFGPFASDREFASDFYNDIHHQGFSNAYTAQAVPLVAALASDERVPADARAGLMTRVDGHARIAFSRRIYRSFDRLTTVLDPHRCDRRSRLPAEEARAVAAAWEDADAERTRRRELLQEISDRLVLVTVRAAHRRGLLKGWRGDIGADTTPVPAWHQPPRERRSLASVELTAGWHYCGGAEEGIFGHSASLLVAASRRHRAGHPQAGERVSRHPQLALGLVRTPRASASARTRSTL